MARDVRLIRSPISVAGMVFTTISASVFLVVFLAELFGFHSNPYIGILFFLVLPAVFLVGLALIPLGAWVERRRRQAGRPPSELRWPVLDLNDPNRRIAAVIVFALSVANVVIVSLAAYRGVEYMDSPAFCGLVCHEPMRPQWAAYQAGPHARVACVECHVGTAPGSFMRAKLAGTRRVVAVMRVSFSRPIPSPSHDDMIPANETCQQCHWPERFFGDRIRRIAEYADDETNTESVTTLQLHLGSGASPASGIHWHASPAVEIDYVEADGDGGGTIPYMRVRDESGAVREYLADGVTAEQVAGAPRLRMACMDCHSRPAHRIAPSAGRAVDELLVNGAIPRGLPFVRREAVAALAAAYPTQDAALEGIASALRGFYTAQTTAPDGDPVTSAEVDQAVRAVQDVAARSIFPTMNVTFGTYVNQLGHTDVAGCFRCHDESHTTTQGQSISQDCELCHAFQ